VTDLPDEIGRLFTNLARRARSDERELALTPTQRLALTEIAMHAPLRLHDLAGRMAVSDATASRAVDALVAVALVERSADEHDRRAVVIRTTELGAQRFREHRARLEHAVRALPAGDRRQLAQLLARLNDALD
jgi:DNA-binding MarR family transcriptional regulator